MACIRNSSVNILRSFFHHNHADAHGGVFQIDESSISVQDSIFVNNSAGVDGGVFYTYIHPSRYFVRRSEFSSNLAGEDGGVMFVGRVNSQVSIEEFNNALVRGGVAALIGTSMTLELNGTSAFNNTAKFGGIISSCNSEVSVVGGELFISSDPVYSICTLYDGHIVNYQILPPANLNTTTPISDTTPNTITLIRDTTTPIPDITTPLPDPTTPIYDTTTPLSQTTPISNKTIPIHDTTTPIPLNTQQLLNVPSSIIPVSTANLRSTFYFTSYSTVATTSAYSGDVMRATPLKQSSVSVDTEIISLSKEIEPSLSRSSKGIVTVSHTITNLIPRLSTRVLPVTAHDITEATLIELTQDEKPTKDQANSYINFKLNVLIGMITVFFVISVILSSAAIFITMRRKPSRITPSYHELEAEETEMSNKPLIESFENV